MADGLEMQVANLDKDVAGLRSQVEKLMQQLGEVSKQGNQNHGDIRGLADKIDSLRDDIKGLKDLPNSFVSRDMLDARLKGHEDQLKTLQGNFTELNKEVGHVRSQLTTAQLTISKDIQTNTQWTIGTLVALIFAAVGLAAKFIH